MNIELEYFDLQVLAALREETAGIHGGHMQVGRSCIAEQAVGNNTVTDCGHMQERRSLIRSSTALLCTVRFAARGSMLRWPCQ
jgi:hypothetical protein